MEKRLEATWLLDFYGALLTEHRREILRMYIEEDLSLSEIADAMGITRQGVHDALNQALKRLKAYEDKLGLLARYRRVRALADRCRAELQMANEGDLAGALDRAMAALDEIETI